MRVNQVQVRLDPTGWLTNVGSPLDGRTVSPKGPGGGGGETGRGGASRARWRRERRRRCAAPGNGEQEPTAALLEPGRHARTPWTPRPCVWGTVGTGRSRGARPCAPRFPARLCGARAPCGSRSAQGPSVPPGSIAVVRASRTGPALGDSRRPAERCSGSGSRALLAGRRHPCPVGDFPADDLRGLSAVIPPAARRQHPRHISSRIWLRSTPALAFILTLTGVGRLAQWIELCDS